MTSSIRRAIRIFNWMSQQQGTLQRADQGASALNVGSQVGYHNLIGNGYAGSQNRALGTQSNTYQSVDVPQSRSLFEINKGSVQGIGNSHAGALGQGFGFAQANLLNDQFNRSVANSLNQKSVRATPFLDRVALSLAAFVNAWRLA